MISNHMRLAHPCSEAPPMSNKFSVIAFPPRTRLSRRDLLGFAARGAASVVVSQSLLLACAADANSLTDTTSSTDTSGTAAGTTSGSATCVLTAALTEGPFFVDEKLNRSDIRTDPVTGAVSAAGSPPPFFNISCLPHHVFTPPPFAYLPFWHSHLTPTFFDLLGSSQKVLRGYQITDANGVAAFTTIYPGWDSGR